MNDRAQRLRALARRLERLTVSRRDPERFFEERSNLIDELREIAENERSTWRVRKMKTEDAIREVINISCDNGDSTAAITAALLWPAVEFACANEGKTKAKLALLTMIQAIDAGAFDSVAAREVLN